MISKLVIRNNKIFRSSVHSAPTFWAGNGWSNDFSVAKQYNSLRDLPMYIRDCAGFEVRLIFGFLKYYRMGEEEAYATIIEVEV